MISTDTTRRTFERYAVNVDHLSDEEVERLYDTLLTISARMESPLRHTMVSLAALQRRPMMRDVTEALARL